jgi:hypothetical protein
VASAGDVNGDGFGDLIVGAPGVGSQKGAAYLYLGSSGGLGGASTWSGGGSGISTNDAYGTSVASAGDVNGDGYGDVIVGAYGVSSNMGAAYLYLGSATGLGSASTWTQGLGSSAGDRFGHCVASAGDVNGDGFSDVIVSAPFTSGNTGAAHLYFGNQTAGLARQSQTMAPDLSQLVAPGGAAKFDASNTGFSVRSVKRASQGRTRLKLQVEAKPLGQAFNGSSLQSGGTWTDSSPTATLDQSVTGLVHSTGYRWRARWIYDPTNASTGWVHSNWFASQLVPANGSYAVRTGTGVQPASAGAGGNNASYKVSNLGKVVLGPVPASVNTPICLYFTQQPSATTWEVYRSDLVKVADLNFGSDLSQCWNHPSAAPGFYRIKVKVTKTDGSTEETWHRVIIKP